MASVVVWTVAFTIYWMYASFLSTLNIENITPTLNVGQISELLFMVLVPISIKFLGFKKTMGLGIFAMLLRYLLSAFAPEINVLYWRAIAVNGIKFGFIFVVAQQYIDINHIAAIANSRGNSLFRVDDPPQIAIHHLSESIVLYLSWRCHRLRSPQEQPG